MTVPPRIKLGPFELEHPFVLAPMAAITNSPFRRLMRRMKSSMVISELVSANGIEYASARTLEMLRIHEEEHTVGLQIFGEDTDRLVRACQLVEKIGADFVDLNLGCPVAKVVKNGAGSAMCRNPAALGKTLEAMVTSVKIPVTIKIRTGWDADTRNALEVVRAAADAGVAWVAIHGRTRAQQYSGLADWDFIAEVKAKSPIPILGNGDIVTAEQAVEKMRSSGVDAVLIGRGALRNPFIFEQATALWRGESYELPSPERFVSLVADQEALLRETQDVRGSMNRARKLLAWYSSGFPGGSEFRNRIFKTTNPEEAWADARSFFAENVKNRDWKFLSQPFLMGGEG